VDLGRADAERTCDLAVGERVVISLAENPTTGYRWQVTISDAELLSLVDDTYAPRGTAAGAAGERRLCFTARAPGEAAVTLELRRQWEAAATAADSLVYRFRIR
jgi:predicted secreted protein